MYIWWYELHVIPLLSPSSSGWRFLLCRRCWLSPSTLLPAQEGRCLLCVDQWGCSLSPPLTLTFSLFLRAHAGRTFLLPLWGEVGRKRSPSQGRMNCWDIHVCSCTCMYCTCMFFLNVVMCTCYIHVHVHIHKVHVHVCFLNIFCRIECCDVLVLYTYTYMYMYMYVYVFFVCCSVLCTCIYMTLCIYIYMYIHRPTCNRKVYTYMYMYRQL